MNLLTDPDAFFADQARETDWLSPVLLLLATTVVGALTVWVTIQQFFSGLGGAGAVFALAFGIGAAALSPVVVWLVISVWLYAVTAVFDGEGSFWETLRLAGWAFLPALVSSVIGLGATYVALGSIAPPASIQQFGAAQARLQSHELVRLSSAAGVGFTLWQGVLLTYATRHARDVTTKEAAIAASVPILVSVGLTVSSLV
ncbi:Yip1 family protein [Halobaculum sp. MBLA0147]|uniref:Yip1 family protein n=1 Tax=Halobaculum sp. MBLA0147 TaxID=3079934 RepID=UPI003526B702